MIFTLITINYFVILSKYILHKFCLVFLFFLSNQKFISKMLNTKSRSRKRNQKRCFCSKCNGIYVDPRTAKKHSMNRNIVTNTSAVSLQDENENDSNENDSNDPIVESSQHSLINEEFSAEH